ncbi:MAG: hypothetical protein QOF49_294, partial [Chloroflexota bacterium]|nr:hypothetical protein [Chloroflexota bacterium]
MKLKRTWTLFLATSLLAVACNSSASLSPTGAV